MVGAVLKGAGLHALLSTAAFMIVIVGTIAAICVQTPMGVMRHALRIFPWVIKPPPLDGQILISKMVEWSNIARKQGLLGLEPVLNREADPFVRKALQLVVDGGEPENIRAVMEVELQTREDADTRAAKVFEGMGIYCPDARHHRRRARPHGRDAEPRRPEQARPRHRRGVHRHGVRHRPCQPVLPAGGRRSSRAPSHRQSQVREMVIEGMLSIAQGENPRSIESKLQGYLH